MKKFFAIALALVMLVAVFAIPTSAKAEDAQRPLDAYEMLMGIELSHYFYDDPWIWYEGNGPVTVNWNNMGADGKMPAVRIQTIYVPADQTFAEGEKVSINWMLVKGNLHQAISLNYDLGTGELTGANGDFLSQIDYSAAIPAEKRTGYIQFVTMLIPQADGNVVEKTFANGELILQRHTHDGAGPTINGGVPYQYFCMNNNGTAFNAGSDAYMNKGVKTIEFLYWSSTTVTVTDAESLAAGLYNSLARYYDMDVVWYPQNVEKNGLVVGKGGVRFYENGEYKTGWVDGRYFLKETGYMVTAAREIGGVPYAPVADDCSYGTNVRSTNTGKLKAVDGAYGDFYFRNGEKVKGWLDDTHYYYLETGIKCTTSRTIGGVYYEYDTVNDKLSKQQGLIDEDGDVFYLIDGVKAGGWQNIDGEWYYFYKETGVMIIGATVKILGVEHTFDENGVCQDYAK